MWNWIFYPVPLAAYASLLVNRARGTRKAAGSCCRRVTACQCQTLANMNGSSCHCSAARQLKAEGCCPVRVYEKPEKVGF